MSSTNTGGTGNSSSKEGKKEQSSADSLHQSFSTTSSSSATISNTTGSASTTSNTEEAGFITTNAFLRSILIDPIVGIPLAAFFNDVSCPLLTATAVMHNNSEDNLPQLQVPNEYKDLFRYPVAYSSGTGSTSSTHSTGRSHIEELSTIFKDVAFTWEKDERLLTSALALKLPIINSTISADEVELQRRKNSTGITIDLEKEKEVKDGENLVRVDFIFSNPTKKATDDATTLAVNDNKDGGGKQGSYRSSKKKNPTKKPPVPKNITPARSVVAIVEFGVDINQWWKKQDQIIKYAQIVASGENNKYIFDQPILLIVISVNTKEVVSETGSVEAKIPVAVVLNEEAKRVVTEEGKAKNEGTGKLLSASDNNKKSNLNNEAKDVVTEEEKSTKNNEGIEKKTSASDNEKDNSPFVAKFGVFLCTKADDYASSKKLRLALLYRKQTTTLLEASNEFGKVFFAAQICAKLRDYNRDAYKEFEYLGPHCCKFGNKIFRSYDTRLRLTDRRPDIYLSKKIFSNDEATSTILQINDPADESELAQFGVLTDDANDSEREWLWTFRGKLLLIATPYRSGRHYATNPNQFIPIIKHLTTLHENGFVHGDIRAYNMILQDETNGWLIDFDYGGMVKNKVTYPSGYNRTPNDGVRRGQPLMEITTDDDWYALFEVMTSLYRFKRKTKSNYDKDKNALSNFSAFIEDIREEFDNNKTKIDKIKTIPEKAAKLKYLFVPASRFKTDLVDNGFIGADGSSQEDKGGFKHALIVSNVATPSQRPKQSKVDN